MMKLNIRLNRAYILISLLSLLGLLSGIFSNEDTSAQTYFRPLYYGMFEDAGMVWDDATFEAMITDLQSRNMNAIAFTNNTPNLDVSDRMGMKIIGAVHVQLYHQWFANSSIPATLSAANSVVKPVIQNLASHPSLLGINLIDDAQPAYNDKIRLAVDVSRQVLGNTPAAPMMIRSELGQEVFSEVRSDAFLMYYYPARNGAAACDFYGYTHVDWADTIRMTIQEKPINSPLWLILQTHSTTTGPNDPDLSHLRVPTIEEVRLQNWLALGEGAEGLFWFLYSTVPTQPWVGIKDSPAIYAEITNLATRVNAMRPVFTGTDKVADRFHITTSGKAYTSTFYNPTTDKYYALVVNQTCGNQSVGIDSWYFNGSLRDVETNQTIALGSTTSLRGGDGKLFELVGSVKPLPPIPQQNLVDNASFEVVSNGQLATWEIYGNATRDTSTSHTGAASLRVVHGDRGLTLQDVNLKPNTRYYLSFWVRAQNLNDSFVGMSYLRINGEPRSLSSTNWDHSGSYGWTKRIAHFTTPANLTEGRLDINWGGFAGNSVAWFDDIVLCDMSEPCEDGYLEEVSPVLHTTMPAPTELGVNGDMQYQPARPTFTWKHQLDPSMTEAPGQYYQLVVMSGSKVVVNKWYDVVQSAICSGLFCSVTPDADLLPEGLGSGPHSWWVRGWRSPIFSEWSQEGTFDLQVEAPIYDGTVEVETDTGRPIIVMDQDNDIRWIHIWMGTLSYDKTVFHNWIEVTPEICSSGTCRIVPNAHPSSGEYLMYFQGWGDSGYATGSAKIWYQPIKFTLDFDAPPLVSGLSVNNQQFSWNSSHGATWYNIWIGTPAPAYGTRHYQWYSAIDLGCDQGGNCELTPELPDADLIWYVRAWGPGGFTSGGIDGWTEGPQTNSTNTTYPRKMGVNSKRTSARKSVTSTQPSEEIPDTPINYSLDVATWWTTHPYNPESTAANYIPVGGVTSPEPVVNVCNYKNGSSTAGVAEALSTLPAAGGTLYFPSACGPYVMTNPLTWAHNQYRQGYTWVGQGVNISVLRRNNVHFISDDAGAKIVGSFQITSMSYRDNETQLGPVSNFYFKNLTFENPINKQIAIYFEDVNNVLFDNVVFNGAGMLSVVNGDNYWFRDSYIIGGPGLYFDGNHASGIINTVFSGNVGQNNVYGDDAMIDFHVNNDATRDSNGNGTLDASELRQPRYFAFVDNAVYGSGARHSVIVGGVRDLIATGNEIIGPLYHMVNVMGDIRPIPGTNQWYDYYNYIISDNILYGMSSILRLSPPEGYRIGKYTVSNNAGTYMEEIVNANGGGFDGPLTIINNCINGQIDGIGAGCVAPSPIPVDLSVTGNVSTLPVVPTLTWNHKISHTQASIPASHYRIYLRLAGNPNAYYDEIIEADTYCNSESCSIAPPSGLPEHGFMANKYEWWVGAYIPEANRWVWSGGPTYLAAEWELELPETSVPQNIDVSAQEGHPIISWDQSPDLMWVQIWMGPGTWNNYLKWHGPSGEDAYTCAAGRCQVTAHWDTEDGTYDVWMYAWGPGGFSKAGTQGWGQGDDLVLTDEPAGLPNNIAIASTSSPNPSLTWQNTGKSTWYQAVLTSNSGGWQWSMGWFTAYQVGCAANAQTCTLNDPRIAGGVLPDGNYTLSVRAWGPGGFSFDEANGDQYAETFFSYTGGN